MIYNFDEIIPRENTGSVKYDFRRQFFGTNEVLPLWVADMDFRTPDFVVEAVKKRAEHELYGYAIQMQGYYDAILQWCKNQYEWEIPRGWLNFSPGVVAGLGVAVQVFTQPGDKIIVQSPVYPPFFTVVENLGRQLINNQLQPIDGVYQIDFDLLESQIDSRTKMLMLCNPHNPVGRVWTKEELEKLAAICEKHDLLIVTDDIHADLVFAPNQYTAIAKLSPEIAQRTITFISPSKTFNMAGLFTSVAVIPDAKKAKAYNNRLNDMHMGFANVFGIVALEAAYKHGQDWLQQMLEYVWSNILFVGDFLQSNIPEITMVAPEGTYLLWLDCQSLNLNDDQLRDFMIKTAGLGLNDGYTFGPGGSGYQRLNVACPRSILEDAMHRLMNAVRSIR